MREVRGNNWAYHLVAFVVVAIWGSTFVSTKMLLQAGLSPAQIFTLRFIIAYVLLLGYSPVPRLFKGIAFSSSPRPFKGRGKGGVRLFASTWRDELMMVLLGITGGSLYFLTENAAMLYTTATNTSLIVCSCPLFTMLLVALIYRHSQRFSRRQVAGSLLACLGMAVVVLNGHFVLHVSPLGDLLAFAACLCWAVYSLLMIPANQKYDALFITRKVFFYGLLTIVPYYIIYPAELDCSPAVAGPLVVGNLLFLGVVASMGCFLVWNWVIKHLGAVEATNWVYLNPVSTILFAWWLIGETITVWFLSGTVGILLGMFLCDRK